MQLRAWEEKDLKTIEEIERRCFSDPWKAADIAGVLKYPVYRSFLMEEGGQVCGYCCMIVLFETAEIANVAVDLPYRRRGIGKKMMEAMHEAAKNAGAEEALLEVRMHNASAIALYESLGYVRYGVREKYYGDEDAVLMKKALSSINE